MTRPEEPEKPAFALPAPVPEDPSPSAGGTAPAFAAPPAPGQPAAPGDAAGPPPFAVPPPPPGHGPPPAQGPAYGPPPGSAPPPGYGPPPPGYGPPPGVQPASSPGVQPVPAQFAPTSGAPAVGVPQQPPTTNGTPAATRSGGLPKGWLWAFLALAVVVCGVSCFGAFDTSGTTVDTPAAADQQSVVDGLARATAAHGICYGWRLQSSASTVNVGSNLGVGKAVTDDPAKCAKYVEVQGNVRYYPDSSESEDTAAYSIRSTLGDGARLDPAAFDRLGAGTKQLLDDPATTILVAADALPLLTLEAGLAPAPVPPPSATGSVAPVATGGNDFLRDRWPLLALSGGLLLVAVGALFLGRLVSRRAAAGPPSGPVPGPVSGPVSGPPAAGSP
ncbi:hypothetical protein Daura_35815 [Dactylosporangium aurantiacum]|uniref:Uncharacterized protein n=1 Tax=Dactylosporangium aurantiacum TaxID=35754 RepID=A0A9Q9MI66_9ACTN|nr:hypothetical protein [Dactylosporangium aurantiacum]MDG6103460.1 hypothetical protein [Dactylosporangium aurantiacum]UWZ60248.1 hypothetical protein Daura_35815 [Dactylosporangium aurantiacum]